MKTFFKKLEYRFLVERTKIEKASFPYKTAISEANVKTNRMVTTKWAYHRERSFTSNYFIFLKVLFQFKDLLWIIDLMYQHTKRPYLYFFYTLELYLTVFFSCEYPYSGTLKSFT